MESQTPANATIRLADAGLWGAPAKASTKLSLTPHVECCPRSAGCGTLAQSVCGFGTLMEGQRPSVRATSHVFLLPRLGVTGEEYACRPVGEQDGDRVVVCLGEELAGRRPYDVDIHPLRAATEGACSTRLRSRVKRAWRGYDAVRALP